MANGYGNIKTKHAPMVVSVSGNSRFRWSRHMRIALDYAVKNEVKLALRREEDEGKMNSMLWLCRLRLSTFDSTDAELY